MRKKIPAVISTERQAFAEKEFAVGALYPLSGADARDRILGHPTPRSLVRNLAHGDFYWLIKKIGEDECLPILALASTEQWQYMLDMELWRKDRMDLNRLHGWLSKLSNADSQRLVQWLFTAGQSMAFYFFFRSIQVVIREEDEDQEVPDGFFTLDGIYYIRVLCPEFRETIEDLLRHMARADQLRYQAVLQGLAGVLPAEAEEQIYRMRSVRLAEHGFLPFEEALAVYSPIDCNILNPRMEGQEPLSAIEQGNVRRELIPQSPFSHLNRDNLLAKVVVEISDPFLRDRVYLEFAGLCNQLLSADGLVVDDLDVLIKTCRRAAGYLNVTLEKVCGGNVAEARALLQKHPLTTVFRIGFGLVLKLRWELERWLKNAWFLGRGLGTGFWGDVWGQTLDGLSHSKPLFFSGRGEIETYRDFETFSELEECRHLLGQVELMDQLFEKLSRRFPLTPEQLNDPEMTFHPLLFNLWSRQILGLPLSFEGIRLEQARAFFALLRDGEKGPPYRMPPYKEVFVSDLIRLASATETEEGPGLRAVLRDIWRSFMEEYLFVPIEDIDEKFSPFLTIKANPA